MGKGDKCNVLVVEITIHKCCMGEANWEGEKPIHNWHVHTGLPGPKMFQLLFTSLYTKVQRMQYWKDPKQTEIETRVFEVHAFNQYLRPGLIVLCYILLILTNACVTNSSFARSCGALQT